jgi:AraC-like DNA-binding protein
MPASKNESAPLSLALQQIEYWLTRDGASRIMVAAPTVKELKRQKLPDHIRTSPKKRKGPRRAIRGRRHYDQPHIFVARWPNDGLEEVTVPSLGCVLGGQADLNIADYVLHCSAGDWVFYPPGIAKQDGSRPHFEGDPTRRHCDILWITTGVVKMEGLRCWICRSAGKEHRSQGDLGGGWIAHAFLARLFWEIFNEVQNARRTEIVLSMLRTLLLLLRSEIDLGHAAPQWGKRQQAEVNIKPDLISEAIAYMEENLEQHLTIEKVARQVLVSPVTLTRRFKEHTGQTFHEYHTAQRLKRATKLLQETDLSITFIGYYVGLKYGQLRALFQQKYGCSPGEFRLQKNRLDNDG